MRYSECGKIIRYTIAELAAISEQQCAAEPRAVAESERQRLTYTFTQPCKACRTRTVRTALCRRYCAESLESAHRVRTRTALSDSADSLGNHGREPSGSLTARFARLRERVGQTLSLRLGDGAGLCRALLLGDRSELGDSISDDFSALGISHIVAVSLRISE